MTTATPVTELDLPDLTWLDDPQIPHEEHRRVTSEVAAEHWLAKNFFGVTALRYDDVVAMLRDKRWHSASGQILEMSGIDDPEWLARRRTSILSAEGAAMSDHWARGGAGAEDLARKVEAACARPKDFRFLYDVEAPIKDKIEAIATKVYGADGVDYLPAAEEKVRGSRWKKTVRRLPSIETRSCRRSPSMSTATARGTETVEAKCAVSVSERSVQRCGERARFRRRSASSVKMRP